MELRLIEEDLQGTPSRLAHDTPAEHKQQIEQVINEDFPNTLSYLESSMDKMSKMLKLLVAHSRLYNQEMEPTLVSVSEVLQRSLHKLSDTIEETGAVINVGPLGHCLFDAIYLENVFDILLDNALRYRAEDRPCEITIQQHLDRYWTLIEVMDNGIGVAASDQEKIFAPFKKLHSQLSDGMGLATARTIVNRHSGRISCESHLNQGSNFLIHLPFASTNEH